MKDICDQCGKPIDPQDVRYCRKCGAILHEHCDCDCEDEDE